VPTAGSLHRPASRKFGDSILIFKTLPFPKVVSQGWWKIGELAIYTYGGSHVNDLKKIFVKIDTFIEPIRVPSGAASRTGGSGRPEANRSFWRFCIHGTLFSSHMIR